MEKADKVLALGALVPELLEVLNAKEPLSRFRAAVLATVLLAVGRAMQRRRDSSMTIDRTLARSAPAVTGGRS